MNILLLKLEVHDIYKKEEKITKNFEPVDGEDVINKAYLDENLSKIESCLSFLEKDYNELKLQYNKKSVEDNLVQGAVKTTIQIPYKKRLFDNFQNTDKALEDFLFTTRRRGDLEEVSDAIQ